MWLQHNSGSYFDIHQRLNAWNRFKNNPLAELHSEPALEPFLELPKGLEVRNGLVPSIVFFFIRMLLEFGLASAEDNI
jgi:hypothetical protein